MARRRKIKPYKISRGSFEEQKLREDKKTETQRALLFILPVVMLAATKAMRKAPPRKRW